MAAGSAAGARRAATLSGRAARATARWVLRALGALSRWLADRRTLALALGLPALAGALVLIVSDFEPLLQIQALTVRLKTVNGGSNHAYAMVVLGLTALPMAAGATLGGSRPAAVCLIVLGLAALAIAVIGDLPDTSSSGAFGRDFESATASPARGFVLECAGGILLLFAGVGQLVLGSEAGDGRRARGSARR